MEISFDNLNFNNGLVLSTSDTQFEIYHPPQDQNQRMLALYKDKDVSTDFLRIFTEKNKYYYVNWDSNSGYVG